MAATAAAAAAAAPGISPADLSIGQLVHIEARTWSFINKPGGTAKITHIHYDDATRVPRSVDVVYSLGGRETNLELTYVKMYVEISRNSRSRRQDVKMNVDTLGGQQQSQQQQEEEEEGPKRSEGKIGSDATIGKEKKKKSRMEMEGGGEVRSSISAEKKKHKRKALASIDRNQSQATTNISTTSRGGVQVENNIERASESTVVSKLTLFQQVGMPVERGGEKIDGEAAGNTDVKDEKDDDACTTKTKTHTTSQHESKKSKTKTADGLGGTEANGEWKLIQDGKITDYINTLQKGQRTSYWWSDEDGWLKGNISKGLKRVVTTSTIKWTITVAFDNGDKHTLSFHPHDKRWKIFKANNTESSSTSKAVKDDPRKKKSTKQHPASKESTKKAEKSVASSKAYKSVGQKSVASATTAKAVDEKRGVGKETCASNKKSKAVDKDKQAARTSSSNSSKSKSSSTSLSFGLQMQTQKVHEVSATAQNAVAFKPVCSETPESRFSTESYGSSLQPPNTLTSGDTENKPRQIKSKSSSSKHGIQPIGSSGKGTVHDVATKAKGGERDGDDTVHNDAIIDRIVQDDDGKEVSTNNDDSDKSTTKRKAHTSIDRDHSRARESKKLKVVTDEKLDDTNTDGEWSLIQDGKISDYINTLQKGQRISYWWSDEDGWLKGNISKGLKRVVTTSTIKWTITVAFDNGDKHTLSFHPHDKRWKVLKPNNTETSSSTTSLVEEGDQGKKKEKSLSMKHQPASTKKSAKNESVASTKTKKTSSLATDKPKKVEMSVPSTKAKKLSTLATEGLKKSCAVKQPAPAETSKSVREESVVDSEATTKKTKTNRTMVGEDKESVISLENSSLSNFFSTSNSKGHNQQSLSFGFQLQSKVQEVASKMHAFNNSVKADSAATVDKCLSTERVSHSSSLPPETLSSVNAKKKHAQCAARDVTSKTSHSSAQSKLNSVSTKTSKSSIQSSTSLPASGQTVLQTLYRKECGKANEFVDYMTAPTKTNSKRERVAPSSPGSEDEHGLVLILDQDREDQFNSLLSEIMYNQRLDQMDVDDIIERMNERSKSCKPFALLEVKPFLQKLHRDNRIFMVEEEGKNGVVYAI